MTKNLNSYFEPGIHTTTILLLLAASLAIATPLANENSTGLYVRSIEQILRLEPEEIDIGTAALIVAEEWSELVHGRKYQQILDDMAYEVQSRIAEKGLEGNFQAAQILNNYLFTELGFTAVKEADYPEDLFLHTVIDNKQGYCLSLSILYLSISERLGLPVNGVVVPGHFFVRYEKDGIRFNIETTNYCNMKCVMCARTIYMKRKNIWINDENHKK